MVEKYGTYSQRMAGVTQSHACFPICYSSIPCYMLTCFRLELFIPGSLVSLVNRFTWKLCCQNISFSRDPMPTFKDGLEIEIEPKIPD